MKSFRVYMREHIGWFTVILFLALVMTTTMLLNEIPVQEIGYGMLLCIFVTVAVIVIGYSRHCESLRLLNELRKNIAVISSFVKEPEYLYEEYYQDCIRALIHILLDEAIRSSIHKYAKLFIYKQLRLTYTPQQITAVSDKKWLGFVMDQLLSNAVKYTKQGGVTIQVCRLSPTQKVNLEKGKHWYEKEMSSQERVRILVEDTGIGISAQDLPRVCEKGYTGYNGHADKYSTGIGLYLCQAILKRLGHQFLITSEQGKGTKVEIII